jgi:aldehyde:ferredoxin oxidoreductase
LETQQILVKKLRKELDDQNTRIMAIGPAGENLVRNADISHDYYHHAARLGMGAVMGSKKLKAITVKGTRGPAYAYPEKVFELIQNFTHQARLYRLVNKRWGHTISMSGRYYATTEGVKNKQAGWDDICDLFNPIILEQEVKVWSDACHGCFVACKVPYFNRESTLGPRAGELRHDNAGGWSANTMIAGYDLQTYLCSYVDYLGLDSEDVSGVVAWMMECYERGVVSRKDLDGIDLTWGNLAAICALLKKIALREGVGAVLAGGLRIAADKFGPEAKQYAMTAKGVAITSYEPRGSLNDAVNLAATAVGELHGGRGHPTRIICDSLTICSFLRHEMKEIYGDISGWCIPMLNAACGWDLDVQQWHELVLRAATLERCYSIREGYVPARDDVLPDRFFDETVYNKYGASKDLKREDFLKARSDMYRSYGLPEDGMPTPQFLEKLGLQFTIPVLERALKD